MRTPTRTPGRTYGRVWPPGRSFGRVWPLGRSFGRLWPVGRSFGWLWPVGRIFGRVEAFGPGLGRCWSVVCGVGRVAALALFALSACAVFGPGAQNTSGRGDAAADSSAYPGDDSWQRLGRATVAGRTLELFRRGRGPRFVWIPTDAGEAVSIQTWLKHQRLGETLPRVGLLEAGVAALQIAANAGPSPVEAVVGRDMTRLNIRSVAAKDRWTEHLARHAAWLCRPRWSDDVLSQAIARVDRVRGWENVSVRLTRAAWRARTGTPRADRGSVQPDDLRLALAAWLRPSRAIIVITGPVDRSDLLDAAVAQYGACRQEPVQDIAPPRLRRPNRRKIRIPGPHRHMLVSWSVPRLPPRTRAAFEALAVALGDPVASPLGPALVPEWAQGVAVRHRHHEAGGDLEILMTLAPTATASAAVTRAQQVLRTFATGRPAALPRGVAGARNQTLRRLSALEGPGDLATRFLLNGESLDDMARHLSALTAPDTRPQASPYVRQLTEEHLLGQRPLVVLGRSKGRR